MTESVSLLKKTFANIAKSVADLSEQLLALGDILETGETTKIVKKKAKKPASDPNMPKKPLSSYFIFAQEMRPTLKAEMPEANQTEIAKQLGVVWRGMTDAEKQDYVDQHNQLVSNYKSAMEKYSKSKETPPLSAESDIEVGSVPHPDAIEELAASEGVSASPKVDLEKSPKKKNADKSKKRKSDDEQKKKKKKKKSKHSGETVLTQ
eukprot:NODE_175_length_14138_cov_1.015314.p9 type:complete len:207 gc:universal NODE_175_length_14138_cov_1.015314:10361-9741(-)